MCCPLSTARYSGAVVLPQERSGEDPGFGNFQSCVFTIVAEEKYKFVKKLSKRVREHQMLDRKARIAARKERDTERYRKAWASAGFEAGGGDTGGERKSPDVDGETPEAVPDLEPDFSPAQCFADKRLLYKGKPGDFHRSGSRQAFEDVVRPVIEQAKAERRENELEQRRRHGSTLHYGQVIQLWHHHSRSFLCASTGVPSKMQPSEMRMELSPITTKNAHFRIMPRYKVRAVGDPIRIDDEVVIESVTSRGQFISVSRDALREPVKADYDASKFVEVGSRVRVVGDDRTGVVRYMGPVGFTQSSKVGIELDPPHCGANNGSVSGIEYFSCEPGRGIFAPLWKVRCLDSKRITACDFAEAWEIPHAHEVNISVSTFSAFTISLFQRRKEFMPRVPALGSLEDSLDASHRRSVGHSSDPLHAGDVIQLFHKDSDAFVSAEGVFWDHIGQMGAFWERDSDTGAWFLQRSGNAYSKVRKKRSMDFEGSADASRDERGVNPWLSQDVHLRHRAPDPTRPSRLKPPTSAVSYFQIEKAAIDSGGKVQWGEEIRLRHLCSQMYLSVNDDDDSSDSGATGEDASGANQTLGIRLRPRAEGESSLFRLIPVIRESAFAPTDAYTRIQHVQTGTWLHASLTVQVRT